MWEDWLGVFSLDTAHLFKSHPLDDYAKKIIDKVLVNMKTPLGARTEYINQYDPTLLLPVLREPTRESIGYELDHIPFRGIDVWNGYELSYLDKTGKPETKMIRLAYDSDSDSIIESKSLKLYFNSFNNTVVEDLNRGSIIDIIKEDLTNTIKCNTIAAEFVQNSVFASDSKYTCIDDLTCDSYGYEYNPDILSLKPTEDRKPIYIYSNMLKSNCRHSGLPDWGTAYISYLPTTAVLDNKSLLQYLISFRNHKEFHEECCERILHDLMFKLSPDWLRVELRYTRRGGLDINPIRVYDRVNTYSYDFYSEYSSYKREMRQ
jgi:7-cyano-7-deazaguanine reductase